MSAALTVQFIRNYTAEPIGLAVEDLARKLGIPVQPQFGAYDNAGPELALLAGSESLPGLVILTLDIDYLSGGICSPKWHAAQATSDLKTLLDIVEVISAKTFVLVRSEERRV